MGLSSKVQCPKCVDKLSLDDIELHLRKHLGYAPFFCLTCQAHFFTRTSLAAHHKGRHPDATLKVVEDPEESMESELAELIAAAKGIKGVTTFTTRPRRSATCPVSHSPPPAPSRGRKGTKARNDPALLELTVDLRPLSIYQITRATGKPWPPADLGQPSKGRSKPKRTVNRQTSGKGGTTPLKRRRSEAELSVPDPLSPSPMRSEEAALEARLASAANGAPRPVATVRPRKPHLPAWKLSPIRGQAAKTLLGQQTKPKDAKPSNTIPSNTVIPNTNIPNTNIPNNTVTTNNSNTPTIPPSKKTRTQRNRPLCRLCNTRITEAGKTREHVISKHLNDFGLRCSECKIGARWSSQLIRAHLTEVHGGRGRIIDLRPQLAPKVAALVQQCFEAAAPYTPPTLPPITFPAATTPVLTTGMTVVEEPKLEPKWEPEEKPKSQHQLLTPSQFSSLGSEEEESGNSSCTSDDIMEVDHSDTKPPPFTLQPLF